MLETGLTFDYSKLIMDNEIAGSVRKIVEGINITDESIALDVIREIGSSGGYTSHKHTFQNYKNEQHEVKLIDRSTYDQWKEKGSKNFTDRANEIAIEILQNYEPDPLPENIRLKIREIVNEAEDYYGVKKSDK